MGFVQPPAALAAVKTKEVIKPSTVTLKAGTVLIYGDNVMSLVRSCITVSAPLLILLITSAMIIGREASCSLAIHCSGC